jgi:hypothetical protein
MEAMEALAGFDNSHHVLPPALAWALRIKKLQPKGYITVLTLFNDVCTIHEMYVAICTRNISYTNLAYTCCTLYVHVYMTQNVCKCINMYIHV